MNQRHQCTIAILAGGQSRRMGTNKSFVMLEGKSIIQHVLERVRVLGLPIILITNTPEEYATLELPMYADVLPGKGSLGGIYTALHYSMTPYTLCVGCDMPLLNPTVLQHLIDQQFDYDIVVPVIESRYENLCAVYSQNCLHLMREHIDSDQLKIRLLHEKLHVTKVLEETLHDIEPDLHTFMNINTPDDLARIQQYLHNKAM